MLLLMTREDRGKHFLLNPSLTQSLPVNFGLNLEEVGADDGREGLPGLSPPVLVSLSLLLLHDLPHNDLDLLLVHYFKICQCVKYLK